ncbi:ribbon-helix-helix protein, CopG family [Thermococcus celer]|uniref:CopG family transcriptional regulator n=1 Tax=Thermococcus celer Vu 13 = JCM 8558 TaxID=1293037 RepID=A0A218P1E3_THECE|nr:ribbon-helix-helix protein, CopG family [Thermococcus celer]ASI98742.1 CopG family transcriptional regulator [Thermococcus celer Vu 13 = JCM 8558]
MGRVKTSVYIDEELWREFKELAREESREVSRLLEEAIMNYVVGELIDVDESKVPLWVEPVKLRGEETSKVLREMRDEREESLLG